MAVRQNAGYIEKEISLGLRPVLAMSDTTAPPLEPSKPTSRLEARISPEVKELWQQAAALEGRSLTDFVVASVQAAAYQVLERHQRLKLNQADSQAFVQALLGAAEPNDALRQAAACYKEMLEQQKLVVKPNA